MKPKKLDYLIPLVFISYLFFTNCKGKLIPTGDIWFSKHYIIMEDWERNFYKSLPEEGKLKFQQIFWQFRSPKSFELFEKRLQIIETQFKRENYSQPWNTDRARIFLLNGSPSHISYSESSSWYAPQDRLEKDNEDIQARMIEVWDYSFEGGTVKYEFFFNPPNEWRLNSTVYRDPFLKEFERRNKERFFGVLKKKEYEKELEKLRKR